MKAVIGLEVHAQLETRTKLFCGCLATFGGEPNSRTCPVCLGLPGALPVPNREAVRLAVRFARAVGATVHQESVWARKSYFYPDLPKGYQISQYDRPLATGGRVRIEPPGERPRWIHLTRVHLEEDAGKSVHEGLGQDVTGIDLNRCGVPLTEIVGAPEIATPEDAHLFLVRLKSILNATGVSAADMEKGSLRCDANVSVHAEGAPRGARTEIKNLNSFRHVRRALAFEIERQAREIAAGQAVRQETRSWDESAGSTRPLRGKEEAQDYRYFPDPDLPPLVLDEELVAAAVRGMPELPHARLDRFVAEQGLTASDAQRLTVQPALADYFERVAANSEHPRAAAAWVLTELLGMLKVRALDVTESPVEPERLAALIRLVEDGRISGTTAKSVFEEMCGSDSAPADIVAARGLEQITDAGKIEAACREVLAAHAAESAAFRAGQAGLMEFFVGQVMRSTKGMADPRLARETLTRLLGPECGE